MLTDIFSIFSTADPKKTETIPDEVVESTDQQPREPLAHPSSKPRPANARIVSPHVTTISAEAGQEQEIVFDDLVPMGRMDPKDPVAHPTYKQRPPNARPSRKIVY